MIATIGPDFDESGFRMHGVGHGGERVSLASKCRQRWWASHILDAKTAASSQAEGDSVLISFIDELVGRRFTAFVDIPGFWRTVSGNNLSQRLNAEAGLQRGRDAALLVRDGSPGPARRRGMRNRVPTGCKVVSIAQKRYARSMVRLRPR